MNKRVEYLQVAMRSALCPNESMTSAEISTFDWQGATMSGENESSTSDATPHAWIAAELHDGLLQWIHGSRMLIESILAKDDALEKDQLRMELTQIQSFLSQAMSEGRLLLHFLDAQGYARPTATQESQSIPDILGSWAADQVALLEVNQQLLECVVPDQTWPRFPEVIQWNILRIAQQAIFNAMKHAGPATIRIEFDVTDKEAYSITISDDGAGFDLESGTSTGYGITSMRRRASLIQADLRVEAREGQGTTVVLTWTAKR